MMERAIQNLIANSVSYAPEGTAIVIELSKKDKILCLNIENETKPLPENMIQWLNSSRPATFVKPSIGLSIVKRIFELHNYSMTVSQQNNKIAFNIFMGIILPSAQ